MIAELMVDRGSPYEKDVVAQDGLRRHRLEP